MILDRFGNELKQALRKIGIKEDDILCVSSDIKAFLFDLAIEKGINTKSLQKQALGELVDIFQDIVTQNGTLLFPAFSWEWCRGNGFDCKKTRSEVGALSNYILKNRADFVRTRHPMYSFLVWGKDAGRLRAMDNQDAWSKASPFYYLQENGAKQLLFDIEAYQGMTFEHYLEQEVSVPYRHPKYFFGEYIDENGVRETRMYSMYVRDEEIAVQCGARNEWLIKNNVAQQTEWHKCVLTSIDLKKSYPLIRDDMLYNNGENTLVFDSGGLDWGKEQTVPYEIKGSFLA